MRTSNASIEDAPLNPFHQRLTLAVGGASLMDGYILSIIGVALVQMTTQLQLSNFWQGMIATSALLGIFVGGLFSGWLTDRFGRRRVYITGALVGTLSAFPFFMALEAQSIFWSVFFAIMLANIAHDMVVCVQQPMFTGLFGASYRYSGAGVGYQVASVVGGGFTPFIAAALVTFSGGDWHSVAIYLMAGCLISATTALLMRDKQHS